MKHQIRRGKIRRWHAACAMLGILMIANSGQSQIIHSGLWTCYIDGNSALDIAVRDSFVWVNTHNGTARLYPDTRDYTYVTDMPQSNAPNYIPMRYADLDSNGHLWAIINEQLIRVDHEGRFYVEGAKPKFPPTVLTFDREGRLWSGGISSILGENPGEVLGWFTGSGWEYMNVGFADGYIDAIAFDTLNRPWFTSGNDLFRFTGTTFEKVRRNGVDVFGGDFLEISGDQRVVSAGGIWLEYFDGTTWHTWTGFDAHFPTFDDDHQLWFVNSAGEGFTLEAGSLSPQKVLERPLNYRTGEKDEIYGFGIDHAGHLWLAKKTGLFVSDVESLSPFEFIPLSPLQIPGAPDQGLAANQDTAWLLNLNGITRLADDQFVKLNLPQENITAIWYDEYRKGLWVASPGTAGFYHGQEHTLINLNPLMWDSVSNNEIIEIKGDTNGHVWFRTPEGLIRHDASHTWQRFFFGDVLPPAPNGIRYFYVDPGDGSALVMMPGVSFQGYMVPDRLIKITDDEVTDTGLEPDVLDGSVNVVAISDSIFWFNSHNSVWKYQNGTITSFVPGYINTSGLALTGDTTLLLFTIHGLYIHHQGSWFHPDIPDERVHNAGSVPFAVTPAGKIYMRNTSLLVLEDIQEWLQISDTGPHPAADSKILFYPNPVSDRLHFHPDILHRVPSGTAALYSPLGTLIQVFPVPLPASLDFSQVPSGLYVLDIRDSQGSRISLKVIKK